MPVTKEDNVKEDSAIVNNTKSPSTATNQSAISRGRHYAVASVTKSDAPEGLDGEDWYSYVVKDGRSTINGSRRGSLKQVSEYAKQFANELNEQGTSKSSSQWTSRKST